MLIEQFVHLARLGNAYSRRRQSIAMPQEDQRPVPSHYSKVSHLLRRTMPIQASGYGVLSLIF